MRIRTGPSGVHLFDRTTGLNILLDEIPAPAHLWASAPRQVSIALTNACNLACSYCYAPKNQAVLDYDCLTDWLLDLDANGCIGVGFGGGEPTLYSRLTELCHFATRKTNLAVTMTTHAHHLNDSLIEALTGSVNFIRVSMDGIGNTYEKLRGRSFELFLTRIKGLQDGVPFGINYVVNSRTLADLDAATNLAAELGAVEFLLLPEQPVRGAGGIDNQTSEALRQWVATYRGRVPLSVSEAGADGLPACNPLGLETGLRSFAHIDASGVIKRTSYDSTGVPIGSDGVIAALQTLATLESEVRQ